MSDLNEILLATRAHGVKSGQAGRDLSLEIAHLAALRQQEADLLRRFDPQNDLQRRQLEKLREDIAASTTKVNDLKAGKRANLVSVVRQRALESRARSCSANLSAYSTTRDTLRATTYLSTLRTVTSSSSATSRWRSP